MLGRVSLSSAAARLSRAPAPTRRLTTAVKPDTARLLAQLEASQSSALARLAPWFANEMPPTYFRVFGEETQRRHLRAIAALFDEELKVDHLRLTSHAAGAGGQELTAADSELHTFLTRGIETSAAKLAERVASLPEDAELRRVLVFRSEDGSLSLDIFETGKSNQLFSGESGEECNSLASIRAYAAQLRDGNFIGNDRHVRPKSSFSDAEVVKFLHRCPSGYVTAHDPRLLFRQMSLVQSVAGTEDVAIEFERGYEYGSNRGPAVLVTVALGDCRPRRALEGALGVLGMHDLRVERVLVDAIADPPSSKPGLPSAGVTLLRAIVRPGNPDASGAVSENASNGFDQRTADGVNWPLLKKDLCRFKWLGDKTLSLAAAHPALGLERAEVAVAYAKLSLALLDHPLLSRNHVLAMLERPAFEPHVTAIADVFNARFHPAKPLRREDFEEAIEEIDRAAEVSLQAEESRMLIHAMTRCLAHTLRTNAPLPTRRALTLRLDPPLFEPAIAPLKHVTAPPFGVFFVSGRHFSSYHVRFADVARGGLRVVAPTGTEAHVAESKRQFGECLNLAWAQQLKNKDIPEGGSKAVCLVTPAPGTERTELLHGCVKATIDGLLDLLNPASLQALGPVASSAPDRASLGPEALFLGPDENITPTDIDWVVYRAAERNYFRPSAFMSSKPATGINHKEFGVTSEGVAVFLDVALNLIGVNPRGHPWTVKLTGGPDGDVAGNMLKILHREYGDLVRVVGMSDGSGSAEDPNGLPMGELLRLFEAGQPLAMMRTNELSPTGIMTTADTPEGAAARNSLHNRVIADAFIPAGGRPAAINGSNWRDFLLPDGATPSAKLIVEGANLFVTPEARLALFEHCGLPIIKDSSANKCGVICSSLEIAASMVLDDHELVELKPTYVPAVLDRLRELARLEASRIVAESRLNPSISLPELSVHLSHSIIRATHAAAIALESLSPDRKERLWPLMSEHVPAPLFHKYSTRLAERLPWTYQKSLISASLASRMVYREGLAWVDSIPDAALPEVALQYLRQEQRVRGMVEGLRATNVNDAEELSRLLLAGGVRAAVENAERAKESQRASD